MRVQIIETGEVKDFEDSYALRLIEQGDAILPRRRSRSPSTPANTPR